jgi:cytochrome c-type biogenesis protein CcmH/NrfF
MRRALALISLVLAVALVGPGIAPASAAAAEPRASLTDIEDEVMCPICGTPLNLAAAPQAERERAFIRRLIANGETKEEIKDALVREYGPEVLATPESEGFDLAAWLVPAGGILLAALALALGVRRWRRRGSDRQPPAEGDELDASDSERLRSDLARYDL